MQHVVVWLHLEELTVVGRSVTYVRLCPVMSDEAAAAVDVSTLHDATLAGPG